MSFAFRFRFGFGLPACLAAWLAFGGASIFAHGPLPTYSTRTLSVAWEMWQRGEWWVPHLNGVAYSHKAPLLYWLIHAGWAVGGVSDVWPRVLELLLGAAVLALTAQLARRVHPERADGRAAAAWVLAGTAFFFLFALQLMFELLLSVFVLLALLALLRDGLERPRPHWPLFALALTGGLLTKGPVMLLHVAFPVLLAPWWSAAVRARRARWYTGAALATLAALALFALWVLPAAFGGSAEYREQLLWSQTAGRVVASFDHARPGWWYLAVLPAVLLPWSLWPRAWAALARVGRDAGTRLLLAWLLPTLVAFSLVSGKQAYYLVPELAGFALLLARAALCHEGSQTMRAPAAFVVGLGAALAFLPHLARAQAWSPHWIVDLASGHLAWGLATIAVGLLLLGRAPGPAAALRRLALASLAASALAHAEFTETLWHDYDLAPAAHRMAELQRTGRPIANVGVYEGQYHFLGRLSHPIESLLWPDTPAWAKAHRDGIIVQYPHELHGNERGRPLLVQPFRGSWIEIWDAQEWLYAHGHDVPRPPEHPVEVDPPGYRRALEGEGVEPSETTDPG
jgi:4-amino-4-deoxy-L-arabinose transferase-like glycosyltransferase